MMAGLKMKEGCELSVLVCLKLKTNGRPPQIFLCSLEAPLPEQVPRASMQPIAGTHSYCHGPKRQHMHDIGS